MVVLHLFLLLTYFLLLASLLAAGVSQSTDALLPE